MRRDEECGASSRMDGQLPYLQIVIEVLENLPDNKARGEFAVFPSFPRKTAE